MKKLESEIISSIKKGDNQKVLEYLYKEPLKLVRNYVLKNSGTIDDANDIFQDAVMALFHYVKTDKYKPEYDMKAFLFKVAKNAYIDKTRREQKMSKAEFNESLAIESDENTLEVFIEKEKMNAFTNIFERLEKRCQEILNLVVFQKKSMREIKDILGYKHENVVKSQHYRCKQYLAKLISENKEAYNLLRN